MNANHTVIETADLTKIYGMGDASVVALDHVSQPFLDNQATRTMAAHDLLPVVAFPGSFAARKLSHIAPPA